MSDEPQMLRTIDWQSVFPFTQLFRAFRIAIHPAKIMLALLAILLVYGSGRVLDMMWVSKHRAVPNEIALYEQGMTRAEVADSIEKARQRLKTERDQTVRSVLIDTKKPEAPAREVSAVSDGEAEDLIEQRRDTELDNARKLRDAAKADTPEAKKSVADRYADDVRSAYGRYAADLASIDATSGKGLCYSFVEYETRQINVIAGAVLGWDWTGNRGVFNSLHGLLVTGPGWAFSQHPYYFILFTAIMLLVWSVIGGAIARIAAVHVSQDEPISVRQALRFSLNKLMSFFAAPVMPLILIGAITLILAAVGWISEIRYLGGAMTIVVGVAFGLLIIVGILCACALIGWVCGFGLMYPTIAVEGSDAFDAVSRSFSYVFARPWKIFVYSVIGLVYGALTYVFLRYIVYLTLSFLHGALTLWTSSTGPSGRTSIVNAWTGPNDAFDLAGTASSQYSLTFAESFGSGFLTFWTWLFVALLGAYVLSFFVSINTIMYYLLRYEVDATEIDDVYLEEVDDEFADLPDATPTPADVVAVSPTTAVAAPAVVPAETPLTPPPAGS